jgi:2'-5' RNA ligase
VPPGDWRLFVALPIPDDASEAVDRVLVPLRLRHPDARWTDGANRHLTLDFLGGVRPERVQGIVDALAATAPAHRQIEIELGAGSGRWHRDGEGVAWLTVTRGANEISALARELHIRVASADRRPAAGERPHVTVARKATRELIEDLRDLVPDPPPVWRADRVVLFRSHLGRPRPRYEVIAEAMLSPD